MTVKQPTSKSLVRAQAVKELSRPELVAATLAQLIVSGDLSVGDYLASENELSAAYEISRPNVRQAIQRLAAAGLVETRHGVGTYITSDDHWNLFDPLILTAFVQSDNLAAVAQELVELRVMVEIECAGLAAERMSAGELKRLEQWLHRMEAYIDDVEQITQADLAFHTIVIGASHNRFLQGIMSYLSEPLHRARSLTMQAGGFEGRQRAHRAHHAIYTALADRDEADARTAMAAHMQQLEKDMKVALSSS